ncbi:hypothetical protein F4680DRAFT_468694 [Xylaria scruposa]|nr:hypothetical protein F4680DRAFT_468694 [Xylaria scruposa]
MADLPAPLTSFPQFTRLPRELRDMIWRHCLPPRHLGVRHYLRVPKWVTDPNRYSIIMLNWPITPPLISQVCRESYQEARRCFQYNGGRPMLLERPYHPVYHGRKPKQESGRLWVNKNTDMICIDANPWHVRFPHSNNDDDDDNYSDNNNDRGMAPELRELLSDPSVHLCINYHLINGGRLLPDGRGILFLRDCFSWKDELVEWTLKYIAKRKECTVVIGRVDTRMNYQEACESGLFGPFAEAPVAHIDLKDDIGKRKLRALEKFGSMVSLEESWTIRDYIRGPDVFNDVSRFFRDICLLWLKKEKLLPRNLNSINLPFSPEAALSLEQLPNFNFVIAVHLSMTSGKRHLTGDVDMGLLGTE